MLQIDGAEITDTNDDAIQHIDTKCVAVSTCVANSGDHRKVVSHIFGRNKACTRDLPDDLWIFWCRKHYQRLKYRAEDAENWNNIQLGLVRTQLEMFQNWGKVRCWTISLRKAEQDALAKENKNGVTYTNHISSCWERFLIPYLGPNKTFAQIRQVLELIERKFKEAEYQTRDKKLKTFPGVEFLPIVQKAKEAKKPATKKKGEITYRKISLDQPAFRRKTLENKNIIKEMAAQQKREASVTPKCSSHNDTAHGGRRRDSVDSSSTTTGVKLRLGSGALPTKRRSMTATTNANNTIITTTATPSSSTPGARPSKRRRLTRGFERHDSDSDDGDAMFFYEAMTKEDEKENEKAKEDEKENGKAKDE